MELLRSRSNIPDDDFQEIDRDQISSHFQLSDVVTNTLIENSLINLEYLPVNTQEDDSIWLRNLEETSLAEFNGTVTVPNHETNWFKKFRAFVGPGALVAVGYMDPGNWSTDIAGGSAFGYSLIFVIGLSSLMAIFLQGLALKAGLATSRDLAQICRDSYPQHVVTLLWIIMEIAICATDVAEVIGSAVALKLLFGLPLIAGVCITSIDILVVLYLNGKQFRALEIFVGILILVIAVCFGVQMILAKPLFLEVMAGFIPNEKLISNKDELFIAVGIIGATVMPHNLFLHSSIVLTRNIDRSQEENIVEAITYSTWDSTISLFFAFFVNAAILIVSAATFHKQGYTEVATLQDAYKLLDPLLHSSMASILFGIALLASGQNSTLTGTLTGQIVMEGFMTWKIPPTTRRFVTRIIAIIPAVICTAIGGDKSSNYLLILSQVILSFTLPFAIIPLVHITSSSARMGKFVNGFWTKVIAIIITAFICILNIFLLL